MRMRKRTKEVAREKRERERDLERGKCEYSWREIRWKKKRKK